MKFPPDFLRISKVTALLLSIAIMYFYSRLYYQWVESLYYAKQVTYVFLFGVFLYSVKVVESGTIEEITFFEKSFKPQKHTWEDGICLLPPIMTIFQTLGIWPAWNLKKIKDESSHAFNPNIQVNHFRDQRRPSYEFKATSSLSALAIYRHFAENDDPFILRQKLGFVTIVIALIYGFMGNLLLETKKEVSESVQTLSSNFFGDKKSDNTIRVLAQLVSTKTYEPSLLDKNQFEVTLGDTQNFQRHNGIKYVQYQLRMDGKPPEVTIDESLLCLIVPAGKEIKFSTKYPPLWALNMEYHVEFLVDVDKLPKRDARIEYLFPNTAFRKESWDYLQENFYLLDRRFAIKVKALSREEIPPPHLGGLACF
jgi:hypothetical protein